MTLFLLLRHRILVALLSWVYVCVVLQSNFLLAPSVDEIAHLPAGVFHWKFARFGMYRVNPPLVRVFTCFSVVDRSNFEWNLYHDYVGTRPEFTIGRLRLRQAKLGLAEDYFMPRVLASVFLLIGLVALVTWIPKSVGCNYVVLVCAFWAFSPNILAHTPTICPDVGAVAVGVLMSWTFWKYLHGPDYEAAMWSGLALGFALLTKLTWLTAVMTLPLTGAFCVWILRGYLPARTIRQRTGDLLVFWCVALFTLNAGYLFEDTFKPLKEYEFCSEMLGGEGCNARVHGNRFADSWLASIPVPVPRNYLLGIDYLKYEVEEKRWSFLMGEWKFGSWPYYYVLTTLYKTPEPTLLAALVGLGVLIVGVRRKMVEPKVITMFLFLGIPAGVCFASVSLQGGFNHHHRYVLMIYPFIFALAAYVASPVAVKLLRLRLPFLGPKKRSIAIPLAVTLVTLSAMSALRVHPYYTSYFNTLSGGPENGWRLLGFSNIDWGQDLLEVDKWLKAHPDRRPLVMDIDYFGMNGDLFDVPTSNPPQLPKGASIDEVRESITETQWWIISVKKLYNYPDHDGLEYLQQLEPVDKIAYAYHVYRIDPKPSTSAPAPALSKPSPPDNAPFEFED